MSFEPLRRTGTTDFRLRPATAADAAVLRELVFGVLAEYGLHPEPEGIDADLADVDSTYGQKGGRFDVLVDAHDQIVGTVGLLPRSDGEIELRKMYLRSEFRGRGLGRFLLAHALGVARARGFRRMTLETATVLCEAGRLYERHGFLPVANCGTYSCRCDLVMALDLTATGA